MIYTPEQIEQFRKWGKLGTKARTKNTTKKQRVKSARKAARARWKAK